MLSVDTFMSGMIHDKAFKEAFAVEAEELAAILEDQGSDEISAFREAVKDTTREFQDRFESPSPAMRPNHASRIVQGVY